MTALLLLLSIFSISVLPVNGESTSLFVPVEYPLNRFSASIAGKDATATTFVFNCGQKCGPVTVIQGPGTAIFEETDQPITTVWNCKLFGITSASCQITSTSPGYSFPGTKTETYPVGSGFAFPKYQVNFDGDVATTAEPTSSGSSAAITSSASSSNTLSSDTALPSQTSSIATHTDSTSPTTSTSSPSSASTSTVPNNAFREEIGLRKVTIQLLSIFLLLIMV